MLASTKLDVSKQTDVSNKAKAMKSININQTSDPGVGKMFNKISKKSHHAMTNTSQMSVGEVH